MGCSWWFYTWFYYAFSGLKSSKNIHKHLIKIYILKCQECRFSMLGIFRKQATNCLCYRYFVTNFSIGDYQACFPRRQDNGSKSANTHHSYSDCLLAKQAFEFLLGGRLPSKCTSSQTRSKATHCQHWPPLHPSYRQRRGEQVRRVWSQSKRHPN